MQLISEVYIAFRNSSQILVEGMVGRQLGYKINYNTPRAFFFFLSLNAILISPSIKQNYVGNEGVNIGAQCFKDVFYAYFQIFYISNYLDGPFYVNAAKYQ